MNTIDLVNTAVCFLINIIIDRKIKMSEKCREGTTICDEQKHSKRIESWKLQQT